MPGDHIAKQAGMPSWAVYLWVCLAVIVCEATVMRTISGPVPTSACQQMNRPT